LRFLDFEYDGLTLSEQGYVICEFGSKGIETSSNGSEISFNTVSVLRGAKHELTSTEYGSYLTTTFSICKHPCFTDDSVITILESRQIMKWLNRRGFHKFKLLGDYDLIDIYFEASFNVSKIEFNGKIYGFELEIITNRPFALREPLSFVFENEEENTVRQIHSKSDDEGYIYPNMEIEMYADGDLEIHNELENRTMQIKNCKAGEIIKINYPVIETSLTSHKIQKDFNWIFFRLASSFKDSTNIFTISIPCKTTITYSPIVKIGI